MFVARSVAPTNWPFPFRSFVPHLHLYRRTSEALNHTTRVHVCHLTMDKKGKEISSNEREENLGEKEANTGTCLNELQIGGVNILQSSEQFRLYNLV